MILKIREKEFREYRHQSRMLLTNINDKFEVAKNYIKAQEEINKTQKLSFWKTHSSFCKLYNKYKAKHDMLLKQASNKKLTLEEQFQARLKLSKIPRNASKVRIRNRCVLTGRSRGVYRKFKLSRIAFRELASKGHIPGITKSSW